MHETRDTAALLGQFILWATEIQNLDGVVLVGPQHKAAIAAAAERLYRDIRRGATPTPPTPRGPTLGIMTPQALKALRQQMGLTQQELSQQLGLQPRTVGAYETGARSMSLEVAQKLSALTGQPVACPVCHQSVPSAHGDAERIKP